MEPLGLLGLACVVYLVAELSLAAGRRHRTARFGAVDASTGRPIAVTVDRRTRARRRSQDPPPPLP